MRKGIYQHRLSLGITLKEHAIFYDHTKKENNFSKFEATHKKHTFDLATSAQQNVRHKNLRTHTKPQYFLFYKNYLQRDNKNTKIYFSASQRVKTKL